MQKHLYRIAFRAGHIHSICGSCHERDLLWGKIVLSSISYMDDAYDTAIVLMGIAAVLRQRNF